MAPGGDMSKGCCRRAVIICYWKLAVLLCVRVTWVATVSVPAGTSLSAEMSELRGVILMRRLAFLLVFVQRCRAFSEQTALANWDL